MTSTLDGQKRDEHMKKIKEKKLNPNAAIKKSSSKTSKSQTPLTEGKASSKLQSKGVANRPQQSETEMDDDITSRQDLEMALQESEEAFRTLAEAVPQIVWATRADGWNIFFNKRWVEYTGMTLEESYGHGWNIPFHPDDKKRSWDAWQQATKHGATYSLEVRLRRADGVYRWWLVRGAPLLDTTGKIIKWFGTCTDIDDLKQAERRQTLSSEILGILNNPPSMDEAICKIITALKRETGFDAIGIRLQRGDDFPYIAQDGFSKEFILAENTLAVRTEDGGVCVDKDGNVCLECTCGMVISGKTDPTNPIFTPKGSCWTNESCARPDRPIEDKRLHPRDRCIHEGYHSVALIALRADKRIIGILQLNDHRPNQFTLEMISFLEDMGALIGIAVARKRAELELEAANRELEERVAARTADLSRTNEQLRQEVAERRRAEDRLRESEKRMERAQEIAHLGSWELDLVSNRLSWSDEVYRIFGLQPQEFCATYEAFLDRVHPDDRAAVDAAYSGSLREGSDVYEIEHRVVRKSDSEIRIVHEKCEHFRNESGSIIRSIGMVHDITERKHAEEALRNSEERHRFLAETMLQGVVHQDANGEIIDMNPAAERILGKIRGQFLGSSSVQQEHHTIRENGERFPGNEHPAMVALQTGQPVTGVIMGVFNQNLGEYRWIRIDAVPVFRPGDAHPSEVYAVFEDISERRKGEEILRRYELVARYSRDIILLVQLGDGQILEANTAAVNTYGYEQEELLEMKVNELRAPESLDLTAAQMAEADERGILFETLHRRRDGSTFPVEVSSRGATINGARLLISVIRDITERKRAEEALRKSEEQFRTLADSISNLAWWANGDGYITWYNRRWYEYTGTTPQQMEGWGWQRVHDPEVLPTVMERWKESIATGEPFDMEFPLRGADGVFRPFLTRILPLKDSAGQVLQWFGTNTDISALKQAEELQGRLAAIVESAEDAIIGEDLSGIIQTWNVGAENIFGYKAEEVIGKSVSILVPPEHTDEVPKILAQIKRGEHIENLETLRMRKDGTIITVSLTFSAIKDAKGRIIGASKIAHNITERKRAEEELRKSQYLLNEMGKIAKVGGWEFNVETMELKWTEEVYRIHDLELSYRPTVNEAIDFYAPNSRPVITQAVQRAIEFGESFDLNLEIVTAKGNHRWVQAIGKADGDLKMVNGTFQDITDRKRAEDEIKRLNDDMLARNEQLEFANKELESFIYSISHDLRAPLRHISGFSDLLNKNIADKLDEKGKRYFSIIHDGTEKMSRLIDDLLNLSRISRQEIKRTEVNMSEVAASIVANLREAHPDRSVDVNIRGGLISFADAGLIEVALSNLLGNAWKFTAKTEHAHIEFRSVQQDGKIFYCVSDNGIGFDQQYAGKMFWPFHRLHSEAAFEGTGIGLAIVDRIIRCHGGNIWAEGIEGKGATIYFSLA